MGSVVVTGEEARLSRCMSCLVLSSHHQPHRSLCMQEFTERDKHVKQLFMHIHVCTNSLNIGY